MFRSTSAMVYIFIQMSFEMWTFDIYGKANLSYSTAKLLAGRCTYLILISGSVKKNNYTVLKRVFKSILILQTIKADLKKTVKLCRGRDKLCFNALFSIDKMYKYPDCSQSHSREEF